MENPSYYGILPANVRYDKNLKPMEKILYTELTALSNKNGYCNAQNSYFSKLYDVHKNTAGSWINNLEKLGYIKSILINGTDKDGNKTKQVIERRIFIKATPINENIDTYQEKDLEGVNENIDTPINEKTEEVINNTSNEYYKSNNKKDDEYIKKSKNTNYQVKEIEQRWRENNLKEFEYSPVEAINKAIKEFTLIKIIQAIDRISKSEFMKDKTTINKFFSTSNSFQQIKFTLDGEYDDFKKETKTEEKSVKTITEIEFKEAQDDWLN